MLSPCEHTWIWLFSGVPVTKGQRCSRSRMDHVYLWMGQAVLLSYSSGSGEPLSPLRRPGGKCPPLPLTLALPDSQRSYRRLSGYGCGGRGDKQNRRPGAVLFICRVIPPLACKLSQDLDFDSIHCCIPRSQNRARHILGAQKLFMG